MNKKILLVALLFTGIGIISCKNSENKTDAANSDSEKTAVTAPQDSSSQKTNYTCPMHPDVTGDKPGQCPKCGMDLEIKT